jgi:hypothetical protein
MPNMDVWDWVILAVGVYLAATSLVRLMRRRRDEVLAHLDAQAKAERERQRQAELAAKREERKKRRAA